MEEPKRKRGISLRVTALQMMAMMERNRCKSNIVYNGVVRKTNPWDSVQLTKTERRGKTADEIQEARKVKWARESEAQEVEV